MAVPWDVLFGLGAGHVPPGASISLVASICWDPEPDGELGGDQAPDNVSATPPVLDNYVTLTVDGNGDGLPDESNQPVSVGGAVPATAIGLFANVPNPFNPQTTIRFVVPGAKGPATRTTVAVYDLSGRLVKTLADADLPAGYHALLWNGTDSRSAAVASGVYFVRVEARGERMSRKITLVR